MADNICWVRLMFSQELERNNTRNNTFVDAALGGGRQAHRRRCARRAPLIARRSPRVAGSTTRP
jgi:hypothetical protein